MFPKPSGVITLLTDFGLHDAYVAIMKGVILGIAPHARLIDVTHEVAPQGVAEAAYLLQTGYKYFPRGTIHLVVVDPGVGSERRGLAIATSDYYFVGPDNGLFAPLVEAARSNDEPVAIVELGEPRYWLPKVSHTFHGRDIFAPVAAHLIAGAPFNELGQPLATIEPSTVQPPRRDAQGLLHGELLHVDRFGNCLTNIAASTLHANGLGERLYVDIAGERLPGLYQTYSEAPVGMPVVLLSSSGRLELAIRNGNAAQALGVIAGDRVKVSRRE